MVNEVGTIDVFHTCRPDNPGPFLVAIAHVEPHSFQRDYYDGPSSILTLSNEVHPCLVCQVTSRFLFPVSFSYYWFHFFFLIFFMLLSQQLVIKFSISFSNIIHIFCLPY
jgi:hypothetical protein